MKVSINTLHYYRDKYNWSDDPAPEGAEALADRIGAQLGAIEEVIDFGSKYQGARVVRVAACSKHPNADKLNICAIDDGGKTPDVERDENGFVQVVCGAPNVREGLTVVWLPPGTTVPESVGKDPFVLGKRELRGVVSNGMLASPRELAMGDSHSGILEVQLDSDETIEPGTLFTDAYHLNGDVIFDIENKMFTHRPDCFGLLGVAREIAGIQHIAFRSPDWYRSDANTPDIETEELPLEVRNEIPELVRRFTAVTMRDVEVKPSPLWLQLDLLKAGIRPISNIVDYTNYFMLLTGQPLHAYDYDKVKALDNGDKATLVVRYPREGEKIKLLNGKEIEPRAEAMMIATETSLIGVGGVMGGFDTEVDNNTKNIILEAANFDMYSIRRTSMAHGLFTDAVTRFNKGQSPLQNRAVIAKIVDEIRMFAGGKVASQLADDNRLPADVIERDSLHPPVVVSDQFINRRLGLQLMPEEMAALLTNVEFDVQQNDHELTVKAPFWRTDIEIPEDIVEEVGRLYGFDHLPLKLPHRDLTPVEKEPMVELHSKIRAALVKAGANEALTYSFVHGKLLANVGQNPDQAFKLSNALSPDVQYYRMSLIPSLLDKVNTNIRAGYDEFALFEIGKAHVKGHQDEEGLPREYRRLAFVYAADAKSAKQYSGAAYYQAQSQLRNLLKVCETSIKPTFAPIADDDHGTAVSYFAKGRAASVMLGDVQLGRLGEFTPTVRKALKLPEFCAGFEIDLDILLQSLSSETSYLPLSRFPSIEQDLCLRVNSDMAYQRVYDFVTTETASLTSSNTYSNWQPVDIYQRSPEDPHKQVTLRLKITDYDKTLRDSEVNAILEKVAQAAGEKLDAERV